MYDIALLLVLICRSYDLCADFVPNDTSSQANAPSRDTSKHSDTSWPCGFDTESMYRGTRCKLEMENILQYRGLYLCNACYSAPNDGLEPEAQTEEHTHMYRFDSIRFCIVRYAVTRPIPLPITIETTSSSLILEHKRQMMALEVAKPKGCNKVGRRKIQPTKIICIYAYKLQTVCRKAHSSLAAINSLRHITGANG